MSLEQVDNGDIDEESRTHHENERETLATLFPSVLNLANPSAGQVCTKTEVYT